METLLEASAAHRPPPRSFLVDGAGLKKLFNKIMGKSMDMIKTHMLDQVEKMHDSLALFLCMHIIYRFQIICHKRNVPCLDDFWEYQLKMISPKLEHILYANISSIQLIDIRLLDIDTRPHYVTRRYAEYSASVNLINEHFLGWRGVEWSGGRVRLDGGVGGIKDGETVFVL